ncbi:hypothetical protein [Salinimonas chungwhensis]|uniref:hypothetical protein n=1 Tax=Salinimonas chungwhensis TaxID=265425 RepID=UPI0003634FFD|nr:hypothetical protein [Salinimonas chungwhensis]
MNTSPSLSNGTTALIWNEDGGCEYMGTPLTKEQVSDVRKMFAGDTIMEQLGMARYAGFI